MHWRGPALVQLIKELEAFGLQDYCPHVYGRMMTVKAHLAISHEPRVLVTRARNGQDGRLMARTRGRDRARAEDDEREPAKEPKPDLTIPLPKPAQPRVIAVANQKGGVGKTTTAVNLGAGLGGAGPAGPGRGPGPPGQRQTGLGLNIRELEATMYDVLLDDVPIEDCIEPSEVRNLFVAPASLDLAGAEIELVAAMSREMRLRTALAPVKDDYDYILIDCPPSLGLLTLNAFAAVGEVLVPIQCEYYALEGLGPAPAQRGAGPEGPEPRPGGQHRGPGHVRRPHHAGRGRGHRRAPSTWARRSPRP